MNRIYIYIFFNKQWDRRGRSTRKRLAMRWEKVFGQKVGADFLFWNEQWDEGEPGLPALKSLTAGFRCGVFPSLANGCLKVWELQSARSSQC